MTNPGTEWLMNKGEKYLGIPEATIEKLKNELVVFRVNFMQTNFEKSNEEIAMEFPKAVTKYLIQAMQKEYGIKETKAKQLTWVLVQDYFGLTEYANILNSETSEKQTMSNLEKSLNLSRQEKKIVKVLATEDYDQLNSSEVVLSDDEVSSLVGKIKNREIGLMECMAKLLPQISNNFETEEAQTKLLNSIVSNEAVAQYLHTILTQGFEGLNNLNRRKVDGEVNNYFLNGNGRTELFEFLRNNPNPDNITLTPFYRPLAERDGKEPNPDKLTASMESAVLKRDKEITRQAIKLMYGKKMEYRNELESLFGKINKLESQ